MVSMKKIIAYYLLFAFGYTAHAQLIVLSKQKLQDKIKGGWAGQTIGVTFGGPYEFRFQGTFIGDYQTLLWYNGYLKKTMIENPGLYDDLYMDLTFVDVFEKYGLDAPIDSFANAFAHASYPLWHANQAARYNILNGIRAPKSGYWKNNPHADCIDYQIESDFAGLMSPAMPNTASQISDKIGHIMNYGDGWYGGVYIGSMYALAFTSSNIEHIITEALKTIPRQSEFYRCIHDVIGWHRKFPSDWKQTWLEVQKKWADDIGCPDGVYAPFNIDAKVNAAYVTIALLYGNGDFTKTLQIATRCGQDADCNPSSAAGILGTVFGYDFIPAYWKQGLTEAESIDFKYTTMSLKDVYSIGMKHALLNIQRNGGKVENEKITIKQQTPAVVRFEKNFAGCYPTEKISAVWSANKEEISFQFEGTGFVLKGDASKWDSQSDYVFNTELYINDQLAETIKLPVRFTTRRHELAWKYDLPHGHYSVRLKILNPSNENEIHAGDVIVYSNTPVNGFKQAQQSVKNYHYSH
jgi:hypothetical protein